MDPQAHSRLLRLPDRGLLLLCTDLHGHLTDFLRMQEIFIAAATGGEEAFLLFSGDLIHGPSWEDEEWPDYLGLPYRDQSGELLEAYLELTRQWPDRVACLLGNHEHSHVGGPHTPKFWPDETEHFEQAVGPDRAARYRDLFRSFPVAAISRCGVAVTHAAPNAQIAGPRDLATIQIEGFERFEITSMSQLATLGALLWSRTCPPAVARRFLTALAGGGPALDLVVYGHEIISEGFERVGQEQLVLSTSFGVRQENKYYLQLDLSRRYRGSDDLQAGREIRRLYPAT